MTGSVMEVLLVEDNPDDAELAVRVLKAQHPALTIHVARDGAEALEVLSRVPPGGEQSGPGRLKAILLDLKLPKIDGLDVLRRIKAEPRLRPIPVIVLTSSQEPQDVVASYEAGANGYVVKPVGFEQFTQALQQIGRYWLTVNETAS